MELLTKIINFFYRRKYVDDGVITRLFFFRYKKKFTEFKHGVPPMKLTNPKIKNLGRCSYVGKNLTIASKNTVIGSFCSIGPNVTLGHGNHPLNFLSTSPFLYFDALGFKSNMIVSHNEFWEASPIYIGNDVWIGDGVFIKNGIHIGDGAVIGARSVVTKDVPPYAVVVGSPAKIIRYRFDKEIIEELLALKWWELEDDIIRNIPYDSIVGSLEFLRAIKKQKSL